MYQSISHLLAAEDRIVVEMSGDIPVVEIIATEGNGRVTIHIPNHYPNQTIVWLRDLAHKAASLAEVIEAANVNTTVVAR